MLDGNLREDDAPRDDGEAAAREYAEADAKRVDEEWKRSAREEAENLDDKSRGEAGGESAAMPEPSFAGLLSGFATQALMNLGAIKNPFSDERKVDLAAARYTIDLLGIVEEKTKGNLSEDEEKYLGSMLYDLRMRYVEAGKAAAKGDGGDGGGGGASAAEPK